MLGPSQGLASGSRGSLRLPQPVCTRVPSEPPCSGPLHAYEIQTETGILKELGYQLEKAKAADRNIKFWPRQMQGCKGVHQTQMKQVSARKLMTQIAENRGQED